MGRRVGICPSCRTKQRVVRSWHPNVKDEPAGRYVMRGHPDPRAVKWSDAPLGCSGVGKQPLPTKEQTKKDTWRLALVEPFRNHASVALDAWVERKPYPDTDVLCEVALREYSLRRPEATEVEILRYVSHRTKANTRGATGDCYCVFCGVLVFRNVSGMRYGMERMNLRRLARSDRHPVECALKHLAFGLMPAAPTVRRLPDEYLNEAAEDAPTLPVARVVRR